MKKVLMALLIAAGMIFTGLAIENGTGAGAPPVRDDIDDPLELYESASDYLYPGTGTDFVIWLYNDYDGSGFTGSSAPWNYTDLYEVKISFIGLFHEDKTPVPGPASPIQWVENSVYNNDGNGYSISSYNNQYYYAETGSSNFAFDAKAQNIAPGKYLIGVKEDYSYIKDWDGADKYTFAKKSSIDYISFEVFSHIQPTYASMYSIVGMTENSYEESIYAGAQFEKVGVRNIYINSGSVTDITAVMNIATTGFNFESNSVFYANLPNHLIWRLSVDQGVAPGWYDATITLSYKWNDVIVTESPMLQRIRVDPTPLLMPPDHNGMTDPVATITQKDTESDIQVTFTNTGNVDLTGVVVRLDLDNAYYIQGDRHYFNERNNGNREWTDMTVELGNIDVSGTKTATFPAVTFLQYLPPGSYMIPVDYYGYYYDDGTTGNDPGQTLIGYWDEKNYYTHTYIMRAISFPEDLNDNYEPYIMIEVEDDPEGPDISLRIDTSYYSQNQGANNRNIYMTAYNSEMYSFRALTYLIHVDGGSPLNRVKGLEDENATTLPPISRSYLGAASTTNQGTDSFYFYADIKEDANPGINYITVDISGRDEFFQPFQKTVLMEINILAKQPRFQVMDFVVGAITDDQKVTITARIGNIGMGDAFNVTAFFVSSTTGYESFDEPVLIGDVPKDGYANYTFTVKAISDVRYYHGTYYGYIYFAYYDGMGQFYELFNGGSFYLKYDIYVRLPDLVIKEVDAPVLDRDQTEEVKLTIVNLGGSEAMNIKMMIPFQYSMFTFEGDVQDLGNLAPGAEKVITIKIKTADEFYDGTTYSFTVYFSYKNVEGRTSTFSEGEREYFYIWTKDKVIPSETRTIVDNKDLINEGTGSFMLGLFLLIGIIVLAGAIRGRNGHHHHEEPVKAPEPIPEKKAPKKESSKKKSVEKDDAEEGDDWADNA
jgi:hypothetical protein